MAKNSKRVSTTARRRPNRTETKATCLTRTVGRSEAAATAPNLPGLAWKLSPAGTWSYVVLSGS